MPKKCNCGEPMRRIRRRGWFERIVLRLLRIKAYRCDRCNKRRFRFG